MVRSLLSIGSLICVIGWLVLSYLPESLFSPPAFSIRGQPAFGVILMGIAALFLTVYGLVLHATWRTTAWPTSPSKDADTSAKSNAARNKDRKAALPGAEQPDAEQDAERAEMKQTGMKQTGMKRPETGETARPAGFHLRRSVEMFWAILPLVVTVGVAILGYRIWMSQ